MSFKHYKHLNVPDSWERYFTKYPQGMTILEALFEWVSQVDNMVDNQNKLNDNVVQFRNEIDAFVSRFDGRLQDEVTQTLTDWQNSGFLDVVISEALQWELDDYITTNEQDKLELITQLEQLELKSKVSITDYEHLTVETEHGKDWAAAFNTALSEAMTVYVPTGVYMVSDTIREDSNGGARQLIGENQFHSIIRALPTMMNKPVFWFGNSTGHGNYRGLISNLTVEGGTREQGNIGIRWHEAGTSSQLDVKVAKCDVAVEALGCIHFIFDGNNLIQDVNDGIMMKKIQVGVPTNNDDITVTASPLTLNTNASKIKNVWFVTIGRKALQVEGGLVTIENNTFQGTIQGGANYDVVTLLNANEAKDYAGGPIVSNNWFEGGSYRYAIAVRNTRGVRIENNFISGSESKNGQKEGAILLSASPHAIVTGNSIRGQFDRTPSESRTGNGGIYVTKDSDLKTCSISDNYMTRVSVTPYFEDVVQPKISKPVTPHYAYVEIENDIPVIKEQSSNFIDNILHDGLGRYRVIYTNNRQSEVLKYPIHITPISSDLTVLYNATVFAQSRITDTIGFINLSTNTREQPAGFIITMYSDFI